MWRVAKQTPMATKKQRQPLEISVDCKRREKNARLLTTIHNWRWIVPYSCSSNRKSSIADRRKHHRRIRNVRGGPMSANTVWVPPYWLMYFTTTCWRMLLSNDSIRRHPIHHCLRQADCQVFNYSRHRRTDILTAFRRRRWSDII